jgi:hypothetical protein
MRIAFMLSACVLAFLSTETRADSRVFIVANQPDGYGIDECLAKGASCGAPAARAYCQSRDFAQATGYHRVGPEEVTGAVQVSTAAPSSGEYIAITCER